MIKTATQLKAKVRNLSGGNSSKAQTLIRNYMMERFLERISLSPYKNNFILKGGMLVASVVGLDTRVTMDIDTTVKAMDLSRENAEKVIRDIISINIPDSTSFSVSRITSIMEEFDYPGIRFILEATLDKLRQDIKIDISTGDVITPGAIEYSYRLMFEERSISLLSYNLETLLAEKLQTIMARGTANSRMRDFYDIYIISRQKEFDSNMLKQAFLATNEKRVTLEMIPHLEEIILSIETDETMKQLWDNYRANTFFVGELPWAEVLTSVKTLAEKAC